MGNPLQLHHAVYRIPDQIRSMIQTWSYWAEIHKIVTDGLSSFRPILSANGTPTYKLAKFWVTTLEPLTTNHCTIKDSFTFAEQLQCIDSKLVIASFEIKILFTNIALQETIDLCIENLFERLFPWVAY